MTRLTELPRGSKARIKQVIGDDDLGMRLLEMGLTPGIEISRRGAAPLGDPLEFEVRGYRLSLRRQEAERVEIEP